MRTEQICEASTLVLSTAWHPKDPTTIGATLSDGRVVLCQTARQGSQACEENFQITTVLEHNLEAWWLAFSPSANGTDEVYSGGDDQVLQRCGGGTGESRTLRWQDRRIHQAGVTYILPLSSDLLLTGSYDDHIRLISAPAAGRRQVLAETDLGGGVWRLKILSASATGLGVAIMPPGSSALSDSGSALHNRYVQLACRIDTSHIPEAALRAHQSLSLSAFDEDDRKVPKSDLIFAHVLTNCPEVSSSLPAACMRVPESSAYRSKVMVHGNSRCLAGLKSTRA